jgi:hypothetical protein
MYFKRFKIAGKKNMLITLLVCLSMIAISATYLPREKPVNLKVLPKDISEQQLTRIMDQDCSDGLGVTCEYCHVEVKGAVKQDYASDAKPEKDTARSMMRMTLELNRKYFGRTQPAIGDSTMLITCYTCHHGYPVPGEKK